MNTKRIFSMLLAVVMLLSALVGCGSKTEEYEKADTLTVAIPQKAIISDYEENAYTQYLEEQAGVKLKFQYFSSSAQEYTQQLSLMVSANDKMPDVFLGFSGMSNYAVNQYGEDGYFVDLTDLIDEYAPNYKAAMEKLEKENKETADYIKAKGTHSESGAFYAMPYWNENMIDNLEPMAYINQNWLDKLGLKAPTNIEELRTVLTAFRDQDPNGNGTADEVPLIGRKKFVDEYIINAFVYWSAYETFNVTDGKVWDPVVTDEYRQALIYANQMVKDGLISSMSYTFNNNSDFIQLISPSDGPSKVGIFFGHPEVYTDASTDALSEFTALGSLGDATGKGGYTVVKPSEPTWGSYISTDCKDPITAMKLLDAFYTDDAVMCARHGEKGVDWEYVEDGKNAYGTGSNVKVIDSQAFFTGNATWNMLPAGFLSHENYLPTFVEGEGRIADAQRLQKESWAIVENAKQPEETLFWNVYTMEEYEVREEYRDTVSDYIMEETDLFITGANGADPNDDSQWAKFKSTLTEIGRDKLMKVAKDVYSRKDK